jgi:hypothetical protein
MSFEYQNRIERNVPVMTKEDLPLVVDSKVKKSFGAGDLLGGVEDDLDIRADLPKHILGILGRQHIINVVH